MSIFERIKNFLPNQGSADKEHKLFEKEQIEEDKEIEKIKNRPNFREDVFSLCSKLGISQEEARKIVDDKRYKRDVLGASWGGYDVNEKALFVPVDLKAIRKYVNFEMPREILYKHLSQDDFSSYGQYIINVAEDLKIVYQGYSQSGRYSDEFDFIPPNYKKESSGQYYYKERFYLE